MSSNPQQQWAVLRYDDDSIFDKAEAAQSVLWMRIDDGDDDYRLYEIRRVVRDELPVATPQASSAERAEEVVCRCAPTPSAPATPVESLVAAVAETLRDFKFEVGPNTLEMLKVGQAVYLTPEERHQIAHAAVNACGQVNADE